MTLKLGQGHKNQYESVKLAGGCYHAKSERSHSCDTLYSFQKKKKVSGNTVAIYGLPRKQ